MKQEQVVVEYGVLDAPVPAGLKILRNSDPWLRYSDDEKDEALEFIAWYVQSEHAPIMRLAEQSQSGAWLDWSDPESAFNTWDFERVCGKFEVDKRRYRIGKVLERIRDLAIMHSCLSNDDGKRNTLGRAKLLVEDEFMGPAMEYMRRSQVSRDREQAFEHRRKARELVGLVEKAAEIWQGQRGP